MGCSQNIASTALTGEVGLIVAGDLKERLNLGFTMSPDTFDQSTGQVPVTSNAFFMFSDDSPSI